MNILRDRESRRETERAGERGERDRAGETRVMRETRETRDSRKGERDRAGERDRESRERRQIRSHSWHRPGGDGQESPWHRDSVGLGHVMVPGRRVRQSLSGPPAGTAARRTDCPASGSPGCPGPAASAWAGGPVTVQETVTVAC
jgi:hypothetical protein